MPDKEKPAVMEVNKVLIKKRKAWLKKYGLAVSHVSRTIDQDYNTVARWFFEGRTPRRLYLEKMTTTYPDWPVS